MREKVYFQTLLPQISFSIIKCPLTNAIKRKLMKKSVGVHNGKEY